MAAKIRKGDSVIVIAGRDKGRSGEVIEVRRADGRALVRGVNMVRDPVCGTFLLPERAVTLGDARRRVFFCSTTCRDKYRARSA